MTTALLAALDPVRASCSSWGHARWSTHLGPNFYPAADKKPPVVWSFHPVTRCYYSTVDMGENIQPQTTCQVIQKLTYISCTTEETDLVTTKHITRGQNHIPLHRSRYRLLPARLVQIAATLKLTFIKNENHTYSSHFENCKRS